MLESLSRLTQELNRWQGAGEELTPEALAVVYEEVRQIAARHLRRERPGHTLQATAVANEVYLRLQEVSGLSWRDRSHFRAFAARLVRRVLVDHARERGRGKRGGGAVHVALEEVADLSSRVPVEVLRVDSALEHLAALDERKARIIELRFFGGLSFEEMARHLELPQDEVALEWRRAKTWLRRELGAESSRRP